MLDTDVNVMSMPNDRAIDSKRFIVAGPDARTGRARRITLEATDEAAALREARYRGIAATSVSAAFEAAERIEEGETAKFMLTVAGVCVAGVALMTYVCGGFSSATPPSPSPSTVEYNLHAYDDTTDRHLKNLPELSGLSDREKEVVIEGAKKLDAMVEDLERRRGR